MKRAANDHLTFLAELTEFLRESRGRSGLTAEERGRNQRWLEQTTSLQSLLDAGLPLTTKAPTPALQPELPDVLLKELSSRRSDQLEQQLLAVIGANSGSADLDEILIGLYRGFGVIGKRRVIQNKLWRLVRTGRIAKAKDKRNVFALKADDGGQRRKKPKNDRALARRPKSPRRGKG